MKASESYAFRDEQEKGFGLTQEGQREKTRTSQECHSNQRTEGLIVHGRTNGRTHFALPSFVPLGTQPFSLKQRMEIAFGKSMDLDWREDNGRVTFADDPLRPGRKQIETETDSVTKKNANFRAKSKKIIHI
jgi:hypothetical protein